MSLCVRRHVLVWPTSLTRAVGGWRPLRAMFVHKVRELGVLRLLSVRVEVVTDLVHVHGDPMFPWLVAVVCVAHESGRVRRDDFG